MIIFSGTKCNTSLTAYFHHSLNTQKFQEGIVNICINNIINLKLSIISKFYQICLPLKSYRGPEDVVGMKASWLRGSHTDGACVRKGEQMTGSVPAGRQTDYKTSVVWDLSVKTTGSGQFRWRLAQARGALSLVPFTVRFFLVQKRFPNCRYHMMSLHLSLLLHTCFSSFLV